MVELEFDIINQSNACQIQEMEKVGNSLDPAAHDSCEIFSKQVARLQAAIVHTYQIIAFGTARKESPKDAAVIWHGMVVFCDSAINSLRNLKSLYPHCGAEELYDLALDYRREAFERYQQNEQDARCQMTPVPKGLFPNLK